MKYYVIIFLILNIIFTFKAYSNDSIYYDYEKLKNTYYEYVKEIEPVARELCVKYFKQDMDSLLKVSNDYKFYDDSTAYELIIIPNAWFSNVSIIGEEFKFDLIIDTIVPFNKAFLIHNNNVIQFLSLIYDSTFDEVSLMRLYPFMEDDDVTNMNHLCVSSYFNFDPICYMKDIKFYIRFRNNKFEYLLHECFGDRYVNSYGNPNKKALFKFFEEGPYSIPKRQSCGILPLTSGSYKYYYSKLKSFKVQK